MPRVAAIHVAPGRRVPMEARDEASAVAGKGLQGDRNFKGGVGQITIVSLEELGAAAQELGITIPPGATRRNITVSGGELSREAGTRLRLGDVLVEVTQDCAPCDNMERCVGAGAREALEGRAGVRARIVEGGVIRVGDEVTPAGSR